MSRLVGPPGEPLHWFLHDGVLVRDTGGDWLHVRARREEALDGLRAALDHNWLTG